MKDKIQKVSKKLSSAMQNSRTRIAVLIVVLIVIVGVIIAVYRWNSGSGSDSGTEIAGVPSDIQSVPTAGKESQQYISKLLKSNDQAASEALQHGTSEVPTMLPSGQYTMGSDLSASPIKSQNCCCCNGQGGSDQKPTVNGVLNKLESSGAITTSTAKALRDLANQNVSSDAYGDRLKQMVAEGKLSKAQADALLAAYKNDHALSKKNANDVVDGLLASGAVDSATAQNLKQLNNQGLPPSAYAAKLNKMVRDGKLSADAAQQLMSSYQKQYDAKAATETPSDVAAELARSGDISQSTQAELDKLSNEGLSPSQYADKLNELVKAGKLTPAQARRLLAAYQRKISGVSASSLSPQGTIADMEKNGEIDSDTAQALRNLTSSASNAGDYENGLDKMVQEGKLTPSQAEALLSSYKAQHQMNLQDSNLPTPDQLADQLEQSGQLTTASTMKLKHLNASNLSPEAYRAALSGMVDDGELTKAQANRLADAYQAHHLANTNDSDEGLINQLESSGAIPPSAADQLKSMAKSNVSPTTYASALKSLVASGQISPSTAARLLQHYVDHHVTQGKGGLAGVEAAQAQQQLQQDIDAFNQQAAEAQQKANQETQDKIKQIEVAMRSQARGLVTGWKAPAQHVIYGPDSSAGGGSGDSASGQAGGKQIAQSMIKAGTVMFAVLNTSVNSDRPGPVMATLVSGKYKGAKLLGSLQITPDHERVILSFNAMSMKQWPVSVPIQAVAINPDTAQTAVASDVNHHYLLRYSALFASSFLQGYSSAVMQSGSTTVNSTFGGSTQTHPDLSAKDKVLVGLGQVGQNASTAAQQEFNTPPTVTVQSGVGLGILFTSDIASPDFSQSTQSSNAASDDGSNLTGDEKSLDANAEALQAIEKMKGDNTNANSQGAQ